MRIRCAAAVVALLSLAACGSDEPVVEGPRATVVTVATARTEELRDVAHASGVVVPSTAADLTVFATEAAEIAELPRKIDDPVQTGDVLVRFDIASLNQELAALQLDVIEAQSRLDRARADLTRQTSLFERGITSRNAYDASRLEQSTAESGLAAARARLDLLRSGQTRSVVRATFPGIVVNVWHQEGDPVRPDSSDPIIRVVDPTRVQVAVQLPVIQLARIVTGQTAIVRAIAGATDEEAVVASKAQSVDPTAPTGEVRLSFVNPATLPVETPVSAEILLERRPGALIVPAQAIQRDDLGPYVMVAGEDGIARRRAVRVGLVTPQLTQVAEGLTEGERVILSGFGEIEDGSAVMISR
ncbi:MAG: efflux RND transporter periplasmic adaptor subunit [Acidobacteria bacterium]|nr:efflux RND transporter periplasmic adaptor subunit [Acidobacteriota bacterium]